MAALPEQNRVSAWAALMRSTDCPGGVTKTELRAALDAADDWADANAASFNTALPVAARTSLTPRQKAALLLFVVNERYGVA
jgi:hypothetical protein